MPKANHHPSQGRHSLTSEITPLKRWRDRASDREDGFPRKVDVAGPTPVSFESVNSVLFSVHLGTFFAGSQRPGAEVKRGKVGHSPGSFHHLRA